MANIPEDGDGSNSPGVKFTFLDLPKAGYVRLVPIIPPDATLANKIAERLKAGNDPRGKAVGVKNAWGAWHGFNWVKAECTSADLAVWHDMGAGIGIKTGKMPDGHWLLAIDADTLNAASAKIIADLVTQHFGLLPKRIGNAPKAAYVVKCGEPFKYTRVEFGERNDKGRLIDRVELLSDARQFVAHGVHPKTLKPYYWTEPLLPYADLPTFSADALLAFMRDLEKALPAAEPLKQEGGGKEVNQEYLKGKLEHVTAAVNSIRNSDENFASREAWRDFGYAIKGALQDHPQEALALFEEFSDRWEDDVNPPGYAASEWARMQPPFRVGASKLYELADQIGDGSFRKVDAWFEPIVDVPPNPFEEAERREAELRKTEALAPIKWINPGYWRGLTPKERQWLVEGWFPENEVALLYGDGGIGKTLLGHQLAISVAAGIPWLGQPTRQGRVMCFFCEDSEDEIHRRQFDLYKALGVSEDDVEGRLLISCRRYMDNLLALWDRNTGEMKRQAVWEQIRGDAIAFKANVLILDTLADVFAGSEIERAQVTAFVKSCLGRLAAEIGCTVIVLGHPSQSGKQSGEGSSGSTAWSNAVRARLYLRYPDKVTKGDFRELHGMKLNYGPRGNLLKLEWHKGAFRVIGGNQAATLSPEGGSPSSVERGKPGYVARPDKPVQSLEEQYERFVLAAIVSLSGERMTVKSHKSEYFAASVLKARDPDGTLEALTKMDVDAAVRRLLAAKAIEVFVAGNDGSRRPYDGLRATSAAANLSATTAPEDIFG